MSYKESHLNERYRDFLRQLTALSEENLVTYSCQEYISGGQSSHFAAFRGAIDGHPSLLFWGV
jgi:hypothetical protein